MSNTVSKMIWNSEQQPRRGDIYYVNFSEGEEAIGSEQKGCRPALVLQNDIGNNYSPTIVTIITTKIKRNRSVTIRYIKTGWSSQKNNLNFSQI